MEQSDNKSIDVNISNKAIDATVDGIKGFLQSLIKPSIDEVGLLLADHVKAFRFKNQLKILSRTQEYLKNKQIDPNKISLKVLVPLLEYSSLEEDESMQDKWAALLANTALNGKLNTSLFSYILNQLNPLEARIIEEFYTLSITNQKANELNMVIWVKGGTIYPISEMRKRFGSIGLEIDNLIRLNLIEYPNSMYLFNGDEPVVVLTELGFHFCLAVKKPPGN